MTSSRVGFLRVLSVNRAEFEDVFSYEEANTSFEMQFWNLTFTAFGTVRQGTILSYPEMKTALTGFYF